MPSAISELYEPLIARDLAAVPAAVSHFRETGSSDDLFRAIARFTVLAFAPTEHGRSAMASILAIRELRDSLGNRFDDWLTEAAIYTSQSRLPWSEPPISDPPPVTDRRDTTADGIRDAIASRDRHRAERWLAGRINDADFAKDFFLVASENPGTDGSGIVLAVTAWKLAAEFGERERYPILRTAVWQWSSEGRSTKPTEGRTTRDPALVDRLRGRIVAARGEPESFRRLALLDAVQEVTELTGDGEVEERISFALEHSEDVKPESSGSEAGPQPPLPFRPYRLGRDYGERVIGAALAKRLSLRFPAIEVDLLAAALAWNLENGTSFEDWSFA